MAIDWTMLGYTNNAHICNIDFNTPANIYVGENPPYTAEDFFKIYPKFRRVMACNDMAIDIVNFFISVASASLKEKRFKKQWPFFMALYVAHLLTLYLQTQDGDDTIQSILNGALPLSAATSKSVDGLSISYEFMQQDVTSDLNGFGTFKYTQYGQQLATYASLYGKGGLWVNSRGCLR